jgi:ribonucleoside-triphosphate reductase
MDTTEGIHKPLGKYIFNNVNFGKHDPVLPKLRDAGYITMENPADPEGVLVTFPVCWEEVEFSKVTKNDGTVVEVNLESAIGQLNRYKKYQVNWTQQNTSVTISYSPEEVPGIIDWLLDNWECYVGVSFLYRADPSMRAADLGYLYLPQEVVTKEEYDSYTAKLKPIELDDSSNSFEEYQDQECSGGACPIR